VSEPIQVRDGRLRWGGLNVAAPPDVAPDEAAARLVAAAARAVGAALANDDPADVEVLGDGALAVAVRLALGSGDAPQHPRAVVETSGGAQAVVSALQRVADLGTVLLAAAPSPGSLPLNLYPDVHVRGLELIGLPPSADPTDLTNPAPAAVRTALRPGRDAESFLTG
jgi:threonine dehydrogenase-like Zn-dependent dehydrogenase